MLATNMAAPMVFRLKSYALLRLGLAGKQKRMVIGEAKCYCCGVAIYAFPNETLHPSLCSVGPTRFYIHALIIQ